MTATPEDRNHPRQSMIKIVYCDEESVSDYLDISAGGKESSTSEQVKERSRETHSEVETKMIAKFSWLPFLGASAETGAGAALSAAGRSILNKTLSNTILTDYLDKTDGDERIRQLRGLRVKALDGSMAYAKMYTPYMVIAKTEDQGVDLSRLDEALERAKGYYELVGEDEDGTKCVLRFNIKAFRNNYGLTDLGRMRLVFHGVLVGKTKERELLMESEMEPTDGAEVLSARDLLDRRTTSSELELDVYDVLLAGVEHVE
ncbi:DUF6414 family protein [Nocardioides humi]|uniref:Uncharacterized protein n=1 Tax=Nocardioides humi TaxID=449461 RepID=A0ABN2BXB2_9ACTN|nr:DUF6414 family protein [Nocardioides humi]